MTIIPHAEQLATPFVSFPITTTEVITDLTDPVLILKAPIFRALKSIRAL